MELECIAIDELIEDPANARLHDQKNLSAIKGSLKRFGQQKAIVVDANGVVVAGNGTLAVARSLGWTEIWAVRTQLTGAEAIAFAIADNRTAELARWDRDVLTQSLASLRDEGFELSELGFDAVDLAPLFPEEVGATGKVGSEGEELPIEDFEKFAHRCPRCAFEFNGPKDNKR